MKKNIIKGCLFAILSAVIFGCMPLMVKNIYADGVNPFTLTLKMPVTRLPSAVLITALGRRFTA